MNNDLQGWSNWFLLPAFLEPSGCCNFSGEAILEAAGWRQNETSWPLQRATPASPWQGTRAAGAQEHPCSALSLHPHPKVKGITWHRVFL